MSLNPAAVAAVPANMDALLVMIKAAVSAAVLPIVVVTATPMNVVDVPVDAPDNVTVSNNPFSEVVDPALRLLSVSVGVIDERVAVAWL